MGMVARYRIAESYLGIEPAVSSAISKRSGNDDRGRIRIRRQFRDIETGTEWGWKEDRRTKAAMNGICNCESGREKRNDAGKGGVTREQNKMKNGARGNATEWGVQGKN